MALAMRKLESSGLSLDEAAAAGVTIHDDVTTVVASQKLTELKAVTPCLKFTYHDLDGRPRADGVCRARLLGEAKGTLGCVLNLRYLQPAGTPCALYLPKTVAWRDLPEGSQLIITEGELKALSAVAAGVPAVGLGGVWSFKAAKEGKDLLPELEELLLKRPSIYVVFDSDVVEKDEVAHALSVLVETIAKRGLACQVVRFPGVQAGEKLGLDDYLVKLPRAERPAMLQQLLEGSTADPFTVALLDFNERFCFIEVPGIIYDLRLATPHDASKFKAATFANVWASQRLMVDGHTTLKQVQVAPEWIVWPARRSSDNLVYAPGVGQFTAEGRPNTWPGWGVEPKAGDVGPWQRLLDHLFEGSDPEAREWFERWLLYPLANPGTKLHTAACLWSLHQGVGKSLIGTTLEKVYGKNYSCISQKSLDSNFNGWLVNKQFVMIDDVSGYDSRSKADILKGLITNQTVEVNIKGVPTYQLNSCVNLYLTSNQANALYLEDRDRRYFIHEVVAEAKPTVFYDGYITWLNGEGPAALLHHAAHEFDFGDWHPQSRPDVAQDARQEMATHAKGEFELWVSDVLKDPDGQLQLGAVKLTKDLFTVGQLLAVFEQSRKGPNVTAPTAIRLLRATMGRPGSGEATVDGMLQRVFAVRNQERWANASRAEIEQHCAAANMVKPRRRF
jgi:hypothetical protein